MKALLDDVFGYDNFLNEIVWRYGLGGSSNRYLPRKHDTIFWYAKDSAAEYCFSAPLVPASSQRLKGQLKKLDDVWEIPALNNMAHERLGYPTQKPQALLERIIAMASTEGSIVLDAFCGSGTTLAASQALGRQWIGIDSSPRRRRSRHETSRVVGVSSLRVTANRNSRLFAWRRRQRLRLL